MAEQPSSFLPIGWERIEQDCRRLAALLSERGAFVGIIAVTRGGLIPAALLSRFLKLRLIDTICIASYDDKTLGETKILKAPDLPEGGAGWLVVDDLVDSGTTGRVVRQLLPRAHFATLYAKPQGRPLVDSYVEDMPQDQWIQFPWEAVGED